MIKLFLFFGETEKKKKKKRWQLSFSWPQEAFNPEIFSKMSNFSTYFSKTSCAVKTVAPAQFGEGKRQRSLTLRPSP